MLSNIPHHARSFFDAGYELRMRDIEVGYRVITKDGIEGTCVYRTINAESGWTCMEIRYDDGRVKTYYGHADKNLPLAYGDGKVVDINKVLAVAERRRRAAEPAEPARQSRFTDDDFFVWEVELQNHNGDFAGVRRSKSHIEDPDERGRTLCGRWVPDHATTGDDWQTGNQCKRCRRLAGLA